MTGIQEYNQKYINKIQKIIQDDYCLKKFYIHMQVDDMSLSTIYDYLNCIKRFVNFIQKPSCKVNNEDFLLYLSNVKYNENGNLFSSSYRINIYQALKKYGDFLVEENLLQINPMIKRKRPHAKESSDTILKRNNGFLTVDETKQLLNNVQNGAGSLKSIIRQNEWKERDLSIILIFLNTGIRCSALNKLDIDDVKIDCGEIIITDKGNNVMIKRISESTLVILKQWINKRKILLEAKGSNQEKALFISNQRKRLSQRAISYIIEKYSSDIKKLSPHKLRATYGTQLYNQTGDIHFVQKAMGHSTPAVTQLYVRGNNNTAERASDIMENLLKTTGQN